MVFNLPNWVDELLINISFFVKQYLRNWDLQFKLCLYVDYGGSLTLIGHCPILSYIVLVKACSGCNDEGTLLACLVLSCFCCFDQNTRRSNLACSLYLIITWVVSFVLLLLVLLICGVFICTCMTLVQYSNVNWCHLLQRPHVIQIFSLIWIYVTEVDQLLLHSLFLFQVFWI